MEEQFLEDFGQKFRLLAPGRFVFIDDDLAINEGHYHRGSLFRLSNMGAALACIPENPNYVVKRDQQYLGADGQWGSKDEAQEFAVIDADDDKWDGEVLPQTDPIGDISSDGVEITEGKKFLITLSGCWNSSFTDFLFSSEPFREGLRLQMMSGEGIIYPRTEDGTYIHVNRTHDEPLEFTESIDEDTLFLERIRPGIFSLNTQSRGRFYTEWVKASVCCTTEEANSCSDILIIYTSGP